MAAVFRIQSNSALKRFFQPLILNSRAISTSKKNSDTSAVISEKVEVCTKSAVDKNWVSYGFDHKDEATDRNATHSIFFFSITLCMILGGFIWTYMPDYQMRDWSQRQAYLEIRRREKLGLPLLDKNVVPVEKIVLPADEELGDMEIII